MTREKEEVRTKKTREPKVISTDLKIVQKEEKPVENDIGGK